MKSRLLLITGGIIALVIAVGCSTDNRTTAPASVDNTFNLPNENAISRFSAEQTLSGPEPEGGRMVSRVGFYHITARGCQSITIKNDMEFEPEKFIELTFTPVPALEIPDGSLVLVKGEYHPYPGGFCMLPSSIEVEEIFILDTK